jgi:hypothetical protein
MSLPIFTELKKEEQDIIIEKIKSVYGSTLRRAQGDILALIYLIYIVSLPV